MPYSALGRTLPLLYSQKYSPIIRIKLQTEKNPLSKAESRMYQISVSVSMKQFHLNVHNQTFYYPLISIPPKSLYHFLYIRLLHISPCNPPIQAIHNPAVPHGLHYIVYNLPSLHFENNIYGSQL